MTRWTSIHWIVAPAGAAVVWLAIGIPTGLVSTPWYTRMTPPTWWSYPVWIATGAISGLLVASYVRQPGTSPTPRRTGALANIGSLLAIGCPVCNKLVVAAVGVSGALSVWAPLQPVIAVASLVALSWALWRRMTSSNYCPLPSGINQATAAMGAAVQSNGDDQPS